MCAQICKHCTVHELSENTKTEMICKKEKNNFVFNSSRALCKGVRAGRKTVRAARGTLRNMPSWNTDF